MENLFPGAGNLVPPPRITNLRSSKDPWSPGKSYLESIFPHNPILTMLVSYLTTPALLSLYYTSNTTRYYLQGQSRFFRHLILIPDQQAEKWEDPGGRQTLLKRSEVADPTLKWKAMFRSFGDPDKIWISRERKAQIISGCTWKMMKGHSFLQWAFKTSEVDYIVWRSMRDARKPQVNFSRLMSRNLYAILSTIPVGRRLTTLVLDGTSVESEYMQLTMKQLEGTLRGLSVRNCPNLECYIWSEWLLDALDQTRPIALEWLHIWGSGNTPTTDFDFSKPLRPIEPLDPHPDDSCFDALDNWEPSPSKFTKVIPIEHHLRYTLPLMPALTCTHAERHSYLGTLRDVVISQYQRFQRSRAQGGPLVWVAPKFPLGEPHPLIALMSIAKYLSISLDTAYCVSGRDCYSFVQGRPAWVHNYERQEQRVHEAHMIRADGYTAAVFMKVADDVVPLHTHSVAEIGARRENGGTTCQNCGLWEDEVSPAGSIESLIREYGGIKWGAGIGPGRMTLGSCCTDCVTEMTCYGCKGFYCQNCTFRSILHQALPVNPLTAHPIGSKFLEWVCPKNLHGPFCVECMESGEYFFTCTDCGNHSCYGCHGTSGVTVSSALYTADGWDENEEDQRFGIVGKVADWEVGAYLGWGGEREIASGHSTRFSSEELTSAPEEPESDEDEGEPVLPFPASLRPTNSSGASNPWPDQTASDFFSSDNECEMDPEFWYRENAQRPTEDCSSEIGSPSIDLSWVMRLNRMAETRIWEVCARCDQGACSGCLGYEDDRVEKENQPRRVRPEYRWCSGGCQKRFCSGCLDTGDGDRVDLVCGGVSADYHKIQMELGVADSFQNEQARDNERCGAVLCMECRGVDLMVRPTICQAEGEIEIGPSGSYGDLRETERRQNDRMGIWLCQRCELGLPLLPF